MNERSSEKRLISIILKGLLKQFETFSTIAKFSRYGKNLDELKRILNFDSERQVIEKKHAFNKENRFLLIITRGHVSKQCRENISRRRDSEDNARKIQCYRIIVVDSGATINYTEDFSQGVMVSCNGVFFNVCCQVSTNNVHSYQLSCGLDYIALCHVIAYVCFFICSSLFI